MKESSYRTTYYNSPSQSTSNTNKNTSTKYTSNSTEITFFFISFFLYFLHKKINLISLALNPVFTISGLIEMSVFKLSELAEKVGLNGLGKVDWTQQVNINNNTRSKGKGREVSNDLMGIDNDQVQYYPGLLNAAGNLCFMNATLQSMASTPHLLLYLRRIISLASTLSPPFPTPVTTALLETLTHLNTPHNYDPPPLRPLTLARALAHSSPARMKLLSSNDHEDAHEIMGMIKGAIDEDANKVEKEIEKRGGGGGGGGSGGLAEILGLGLGSNLQKEGKKSIRDPFIHLMSQKITCMNCSYTRDVRHIIEDHVGVIVPPLNVCTLDDLIKECVKMELLSEYGCRKCSLLATYDKLIAQRDRLSLPTTTSTPSTPSTPILNDSITIPSIATSSSQFTLPTTPPISTSTTSIPIMTQSKKDRKKKVQKLVDKVEKILKSGDFEQELGEEIKVEKVSVPAGKQLKFARTPNILAFHLRRSNHYGAQGAVKNLCRVIFPEFLDLSLYSDYPTPSSTTPLSSPNESPTTPIIKNRDIYRLSSLVVHYGTHEYGHYVSFRRSPHTTLSSTSTSSSSTSASIPTEKSLIIKPEWYRISDENVSPSSLEEVLSGNPFLIFYERFQGELIPFNESLTTIEGNEGIKNLRMGGRGIEARVWESWRNFSDEK